MWNSLISFQAHLKACTQHCIPFINTLLNISTSCMIISSLFDSMVTSKNDSRSSTLNYFCLLACVLSNILKITFHSLANYFHIHVSMSKLHTCDILNYMFLLHFPLNWTWITMQQMNLISYGVLWAYCYSAVFDSDRNFCVYS